MSDKTVPGPSSPPIVPGDMGWPSRERLDALASTLSIFEWLDANGIDSPEVARVKTAFMFEHGPTAERWLRQADPPPSWEQMAYLLRENQQLREAAEHVLDTWDRKSTMHGAIQTLRALLTGKEHTT